MFDDSEKIASALRQCGRVLVVPHVNPDGDAVGSAFALAHMALRLDADARILLYKGLPDYLSWIPAPAPLVNAAEALGPWVPDMIIYADCADAARAGASMAVDTLGAPLHPGWRDALTVNIDHHISNPGFARLNWVVPERSATGELVGLLAEKLGLALSGGLGEAVYLALVSDTGSFSYANTSAAALGMAARIVGAGLDVASFTSRYENNWSLGRMHLWGRLMSEIRLYADGAVAVSVVPGRYLQEFGLRREALEGYASWLRRLKGVRVALFVREDGPEVSKISLRSMGDFDVQAVTALFGGGGHAAAAGAELPLPPESAADAVLKAVLERLKINLP